MLLKIFLFAVLANFLHSQANELLLVLSPRSDDNRMRNFHMEQSSISDEPSTSPVTSWNDILRRKAAKERLESSLADDQNAVQETVYTRHQYGKKFKFHFTVGARREGDRFLTTNAKQNSWKSHTNATLQLKYPTGHKKNGRQLTYVAVEVFQRSPDNRVYVAKGGIGENYIKIVIEANSTTYLGYNATFFGI